MDLNSMIENKVEELLQARLSKLEVKGVFIDRLINTTEVGQLLGCTRQHVYAYHMNNGLKACYPSGLSGNKKFKLSDVQNYIANIN